MTDPVELALKDAPPLKGIQIWLEDDYLQVEVGHYPDGSDRREHTYARRVYADEGGPAMLTLLREFAASIATGVPALPVWERGATIPGYRGSGTELRAAATGPTESICRSCGWERRSKGNHRGAAAFPARRCAGTIRSPVQGGHDRRHCRED